MHNLILFVKNRYSLSSSCVRNSTCINEILIISVTSQKEECSYICAYTEYIKSKLFDGINTIIQQECIIFVKSDSKDNVTKDSHFKEMLFFSTFLHQ